MEGKEWAVVIAAVFGGLASLVAAVFAGLATLYAAKANARTQENGRNIETIEKATNSMKDALVKATSEKAFLQGKQEERRNPGSNDPQVQTALPDPMPPLPPSAHLIRKDIAELPEKTADKVVEKMRDADGTAHEQ